MFDLGIQELILIFVVALLVFGPKRLPELSRALGKGLRELKIALRGVKDSIEEAETSVSEEIKEAKAGLEETITKGIKSEVSSKEGKEEKGKTQTEQSTPEATEGEIKGKAGNG